jgi:hypothetical protein
MTGEPRNAAFVPYESLAQETATCVRLGRPSLSDVFSIHLAAGIALVKMLLPLIGYRSWYCDRKRLVMLGDFCLYVHFLRILQSRSSSSLTILLVLQNAFVLQV